MAARQFKAYLTFNGITHVHKADCADLHPNRLRNSQHDQPYDVQLDVPTDADADVIWGSVVREVMADFQGEMTLDEMADQVHFAPCTGLCD